MRRILYKDLLSFSKKLLLSVGLDKFSARSVSNGLCEASLRGVDSHGINLLPHYVNSAIKGRKNPKPHFVFNSVFQSFGVLDADHAFGHAAGEKSIDLAIPIAKKYGVSMIAVKNSTHPGALASFTLKAARKGYAAFAFTHSDSLMLSANSKEKYFGTNPISFSCPREGSEEPYCLDMATTIISWNKLLNTKKENAKLNGKFASNKRGQPTNDPKVASSLMPIGDYKGFGLASMIEILCGVLTGMSFGKSIPPMFDYPINKKRFLGQFYIVFRIDAALSKKNFTNRMKIMTKEVRKLKPIRKNIRVKLPNDPEIQNSKYRIKKGIPLDDDLFKKLSNIANKYNLNIKLINE
tara:strand:+ start:268 stop:1320 length:1053 start_codon:yes stop_codon:yes gene_type:complete